MATNTDIKAALSFTGDVFGIGPKTVGNTELGYLKAWFEDEYAEELDGAEATAQDFGAWLYRQVEPKVRAYLTRLRDEANSEPSVAEFSE